MNTEPFLRIERGRVEPDELAAVISVLTARAATPEDPGDGVEPRSTVGWRRLERRIGFGSPHSWQTAE